MSRPGGFQKLWAPGGRLARTPSARIGIGIPSPVAARAVIDRGELLDGKRLPWPAKSRCPRLHPAARGYAGHSAGGRLEGQRERLLTLTHPGSTGEDP